MHRDVAQLGSALRSGRRGRRFKSCHPDHVEKKAFEKGLFFFFLSVPGMARIQSEIDRSQVVTAKCSEPQVVDSDVKDEGSGVAILSSVRTETGYKAKWWIRLLNKPKSKR